MTRVFRLHSTLEIPLDELTDYLESDPELPENVADIDVERRDGTLVLKAVAEDASMSKYTPTAQLKATVSEVRVTEEPERPQWGQSEAEEPPSKLVEMAWFKGDRETVLQNTALQYEMFLVLCDLAELAERGELTAITEVDGDLEATRYVEGEPQPASIEVVEEPAVAGEDSVDWRNNQYIGGTGNG
ncbi:MAG: hypothetical protein ABEH77_06620 [Halobacteriaceae archaeon]